MFDFAGEEGLASTRVSHAEEHAGLTCLESLERTARLVGLAVRLSIAKDGDAVVRTINNRQVNERTGRSGLLRRIEVACAIKAFAARRPFLRLSFTEDNRIEHSAILALDGNRRPAALLQIRQRDPGLQRLLADISRERRGLIEGAFLGELQTSVGHHGTALEFARRVGVPGGVENPAHERRRAGLRRAGPLPGCGQLPTLRFDA